MSIRCGSEPQSPDGCGRHVSSSSSSLLSYADGGCTSPAPIPANLHACHESRSEALRRYGLSFGIARQPGRVFFDPDQDVLYFGPRDGFMASEAQLRTVLTLCCPEELRRVRKVAINDALFWVYERSRRTSGSSNALLHPYSAATTSLPLSSCRGEEHSTTRFNPHYEQPSSQQYHQRRQHWPGGFGAGGLAHATIATSLLADTLQLLRTRLPGLRELVFVPRDENPLYSEDCCLVEPAMMQSRMARQVRDAMAVVFGGDGGFDSTTDALPLSVAAPPPPPPRIRGQQEHKGLPATNVDDQESRVGGVPWIWKIMTLCADPDPPVYGRKVLGWEDDDHNKTSPRPKAERQSRRQQPKSSLNQECAKGGVGGGSEGRGRPTAKASQPINRNKRKREASTNGTSAAAGPQSEVSTEAYSLRASTKAWDRRKGMTRVSLSLPDGRRRTRFVQQVELGVCV